MLHLIVLNNTALLTLFKMSPLPSLLLLSDSDKFTIVEVNNEYLKATGTTEEDLINRGIFEAFPDNPEDRNAVGVSELRKSLLYVINSGEPHKMDTQKYDIPIRGTDKFELRYWDPLNVPIKNSDNKVEYILHTVQEVTARELSILSQTETKEILHTSENRFKNIFDFSAAGIAMASPEGKWIVVNKQFCTITGYTKEELLSMTIVEITHPDDLEKTRWSIQKLGSGELNNFQTEKRYLHKLGYPVWVLMTVSSITKPDGLPDYFIGHFLDITDKKAAEQSLKESEQRFQSLFYNNPHAVYSFDSDGNFISGNNALAILAECSLEEILKSSFISFIAPEEKDRVNEYFKKAKKGEVQTYETRIITAKGNSRFITVTKMPIIVENKIKGIYGVSQDITDQKEAIEKTRQSNERFERVAEATNDAIWDWDIISNKLIWGDGYQKLFGHELKKIGLTFESWTSQIHPEDILAVKKSLHNAIINENINDWEYEYRLYKSDKTIAYVINRGAIIRNKKRVAIRMVGGMTDITQKKEYEKSLKKLNDTLKRTNRDLEHSNKDLEDFAYISSHDLQEPLRMISSYLSLIKMKYEKVLDVKGISYLDFAVDSSLRMQQIILDVLEFSKIGKTKETLVEVNLNVLITEIINLYQKQINDTNTEIKYNNLPIVLSYKTPLTQVFQNLISNALKYRSKIHKPLIQISCEEEDAHWKFTITDNGIGINPIYSEKIFDIFQRLHGKQEYSGTGIGLAIVKKIIENLGGKIWINSEEGIGSSFYFTILK